MPNKTTFLHPLIILDTILVSRGILEDWWLDFKIFLFFLSWSGLCDPIACSLLGGGIATQNSGYKVTRLCPS